MSVRRASLLAMVVGVLVLLGGRAFAEPAPPTTAEQIEDWWATYESQYLVEWYRSKGTRDAKWDADAEAWLAIYGEKAARRQAVTPAELKIGQRVIDAGCTDPVIRLMVRMDSATLASATRTQRLLLSEEVESLVDAAEKADCPPMRLWRTCIGVLRLKADLREDRDVLTRWVGRTEDYLTAAASQKNLPPLAERLIVAKFVFDIDQAIDNYSSNLIDKLGASACSEWLRGVLIGEYHTKNAWVRRGNGYANSVGEAGWKGFHDELNDAHEALSEAYAADPSRPEAPTRLITVVAGLGEKEGESEQMWFDRAIKAQVDYYPAYLTRLWFLYPRWGGTHEQMMRVGEGAFRTGRFDTAAPGIYLESVYQICKDTADFLTPFSKPEVIAKLAELRAGYEKTPGPAADHWLSIIAHTYYRVGMFVEANDVVTSMGSRFQKRWASFPRVSESEFSVIYAYAAPIRALVRGADEAAGAEIPDFDKAESLLKEALVKAGDDAVVKKAVERKLALLGFRRPFEQGDWASLIQGPRPLDLFDEEGSEGAWSVDGTTLIATKPIRWWSSLTFQPIIGPHYHYKARVQVPRDGQSPKVGVGLFVAASVDTSPDYFEGAFVFPELRTWVYAHTWARGEQKPLEINETTMLEVLCWDEEVVVRIAGETVYAGPAVGGFGRNADNARVGMGLMDRNPAARPIRFDAPAVKKLTVRPSELGGGRMDPEARPRRPREPNRPRF